MRSESSIACVECRVGRYVHIIIRQCGPRLALTIASHLIPQRKVRSAERSTCERSRVRGFRTRKQYRQTSKHFPLVFPLVEVSIGTRKPCGLPPIIDSILLFSDHCLAETGPRNILRGVRSQLCLHDSAFLVVR